MTRLLALASALFLVSAQGGAAQDLCQSVVNGSPLLIDRNALGPEVQRPTRRERLLSWPGRKIDTLRGQPPDCDSQALIRYLSLETEAADIDGWCLSEQDSDEYILLPGARNFRGRCTRSTCERVNATKETALNVADRIVGKASGQTPAREPDTESKPGSGALDAILHASGAAILKGSGLSVSGALSSLGTALSAPAVLAATAVTVVAVGGAVYICRDG